MCVHMYMFGLCVHVCMLTCVYKCIYVCAHICRRLKLTSDVFLICFPLYISRKSLFLMSMELTHSWPASQSAGFWGPLSLLPLLSTGIRQLHGFWAHKQVSPHSFGARILFTEPISQVCGQFPSNIWLLSYKEVTMYKIGKRIIMWSTELFFYELLALPSLPAHQSVKLSTNVALKFSLEDIYP